MMKNSTLKNLLLLLLICVIPRNTYGSPIDVTTTVAVPTLFPDTTLFPATTTTEAPPPTNSTVANTVISGVSLLKNVLTTINVMDQSSRSGLGAIITQLTEVSALPYNMSHIKIEVLVNLYETEARVTRIRGILETMATQLKSGCEDLILLYNMHPTEYSIEFLNYSVTKFVKLARDVKETLEYADELLTTSIQEVFPRTTASLKVYDGEIDRIRNELEERKSELQKEIETFQTITTTRRRRKRFVIGAIAVGLLLAEKKKDNEERENAKRQLDAALAELATTRELLKTAQKSAEDSAAAAQAAIESARKDADRIIADANAKAAAAKAEQEAAKAALDRIKEEAANATAHAIKELKVANRNIKIVNRLDTTVSGLIVANMELKDYVETEISLIDDWKAKLQTSLRDHEDGLTPADVRWGIAIIKKNLEELITSCDNYLAHVLPEGGFLAKVLVDVDNTTEDDCICEGDMTLDEDNISEEENVTPNTEIESNDIESGSNDRSGSEGNDIESGSNEGSGSEGNETSSTDNGLNSKEKIGCVCVPGNETSSTENELNSKENGGSVSEGNETPNNENEVNNRENGGNEGNSNEELQSGNKVKGVDKTRVLKLKKKKKVTK